MKKILFLLFPLLLFPGILYGDDLANQCLVLADKGCQTADPNQCKKSLEQCEAYFSAESAKIEEDISKTQKEKDTLNNKIYSLNQKIKSLGYQISQSNLIIKDLTVKISDTSDSIEITANNIEESKKKLAELLRTLNEEKQLSSIEILLSGDNLSDFFDNLIALETLDSKSKEMLDNIKIMKTNLEEQKDSLDSEKDDLENTVKISTLQKESNSKAKQEQEYFLGLTEKEYQKKVQEKKEAEKKVAAIRARIFEIIGVSKAPTFGEAYDIAKYVEGITGVRPALLLAVLKQESDIGKNVGQCYLKNFTTGDGVIISSGRAVSRVMKPSRDVPVFLEITADIGKDPKTTPVSCPMSFGYGGAMGPAQFIPSTWNLYRSQLNQILGRPANPWVIKDSFLAAGLYLSKSGAGAQTYNAEWRAAMIYFSGSTNSKYSFYGNSVMNNAKALQGDINAMLGL